MMKAGVKIFLLVACVFLFGVHGYAAVGADYTLSWERLLFTGHRAGYFSPEGLFFDKDGHILLVGTGRHNVHNIDNVFYKINTAGLDVSVDSAGQKPTGAEEMTGSYVPTSDGGYIRERSTSSERFIEKLDSNMTAKFSVSLQKDLGLPPEGGSSPAGSQIRDWIEVDDGYIFFGSAGMGKAVSQTDYWSASDPWYFKISSGGYLLWDKVIGGHAAAGMVAAADGPGKFVLLVQQDGSGGIRYVQIDSRGGIVKESRDAGRYVDLARTPGGDLLLLTVTYEDASYTDGSRSVQQSNSVYHISKLDKDLHKSWEQSFYGTKYNRHLQFANNMYGITALENGNFIVYGDYAKARPAGLLGSDPAYKAQGYFKIFDSGGNLLGEKFITPDESQGYVITSLIEGNGDLYFLGYRGAKEYVWLGRFSADKGQQSTWSPSPAESAAQHAGINVYIDGQKQSFADRPVLVQGRTLLPMRALFEALGADVHWDAQNNTAVGSRDGVEVRIPIGSTSPAINGIPATIDVPARLIGGRTYIPLRFMGEALGDEVVWNGETGSVIITKKV